MKRLAPLHLALTTSLVALLVLSAIARQHNSKSSLPSSSNSAVSIIPRNHSPQSGTEKSRRPQRTLADFDIRADHERSLETPPEAARGRFATQAASTEEPKLRRERPQALVRWSSLAGTPSRVYSTREPLSRASSDDPELAARRFLKENADLYRLGDDDLAGLRVSRRHTTAHNGLTHLTLEQRINGIEVFGSRLTAHLDRTGAVIATTGELLPGAARAINLTRSRINPTEALKLAATYADAEISNQIISRPPAGEEQRQSFDKSAGFGRDVQARLVYFPLAADKARLAWEFELWMKDTPDAYLIVVDAERGGLLYRYNLTCYEENPLRPHGLIFTGDSPRPDLPHANDNPPTVERQDLPFRPAPFNSSIIFAVSDPHFDWWAGVPADSLTSNNVDAHLDRDANNQADAPLLKAADGNFSFPLDLAQQPTLEDNQKAAQANLFYWANRYHDILYSFGFTESAGNFQTKNFGLGGLEGDAIQADAQDGSGTNNANFSTPPDGRAGRVQMFLWTGSPQLDGDLDQSVILHELTHGVSNRLVGNSTGLAGFQSRGMGEGWSDYFGLVLMRSENDPLDGAYPVGQYVRNNYPVGIRRYPYSTKTTVNPLTFANISLSTSVHATGEIWCNTLWEMRALLIQKYGFREGQRQSIQLVVDGLKLTPNDPTFLDARDAILLADRVNNGGANQCLMWQAFAKRGMGYAASTVGSSDGAPKESFDTPAYCSDSGSIQLDRRDYVIGEAIRVTLGDRNATAPVRVQVTSSATGDQETVTLTPDPVYAGSYHGSLRIAAGRASQNDGSLQASVEAGDQITVSYHDASAAGGTPATITASAGVVREKTVFEDTVENGNQGWIVSGAWAITNSRSASASHAWADSPAGNYANNSDTSLTSPLLDLSNLSDVTLSIAHSYDLEYRYDFGIVEYSTDDGATWAKAAAFTGRQSGFVQSKVNLDALAGRAQARVRFRLLSDPAEVGDGWYIDDIRITARSADPAVIRPGNAPAPVMSAISPAFGAPAGGTRVTITGSNFTDTEDTTVSFDGLPATGVNVTGSTTLTATVPAHTLGAVTVRITSRNGSAALPGGFTYYQSGGATNAPAPKLERLFPVSGSTRGGTLVTLVGANFTPETTVAFGAKTAAVTFVSEYTLRVTTPVVDATGTVAVAAGNGGNRTTLDRAFAYTNPTPPSVQVLNPNGGDSLFIGSTINIRWQSSDNRAITRHGISLVRNAGSQLITLAEIAGDLPGDAQSFNWMIPSGLEQPQVRIRITATDDEGVEAEAFSGDFTIARRWEPVAALPFPLQRLAAASDGRSIFAIGGRTALASNTTVETVSRFDPATNLWTNLGLAPISMGLSSGDAVYLNGKIYVPGGFTSTSSSPVQTHYAYDVAANSWSMMAAAPSVAYFYALAADEARGVYYLTGGNNNLNGAVATVRVYNPQANAWSDLPPMSVARYGHEAAMIEGKLYVVGGFGISGGLAGGEVYDFAAQKWSPIAGLSRQRRFASGAVGKDPSGNPLWLIVGGEDPNTGALISTAEAYDVRNNRWMTLDTSFNQITPRTQMAGATQGGMFYTVGGAQAGSAPTSIVTSAAVERVRVDGFAPLGSSVPPVLAVPVAQLAVAGRETRFSVTAGTLNSATPITITAAGLPERASFTTTNATNNSARGEFRWTPAPEDAGKAVMLKFTASDGVLGETRSVSVRVIETTPLAVVSAASYRGGSLAPDSIAAAFGVNLAVRTEAARETPLPLELAGTSVTVNGVPAPLFFVSPGQVNFAVPPGADVGNSGPATVIVSTPLGSYALGTTILAASQPAIFTANASGAGEASAVATPDGITYQRAPFDVTMNGRPNILVLYGTGFRNARAVSPADDNGVAEALTVTIGGLPAQVLYAGAQGRFVGLDQINAVIPPALAGSDNAAPRQVEVVVTLNGVEANRVTVMIR